MKKRKKLKFGTKSVVVLISVIALALLVAHLTSLVGVEKNVGRRALVEVNETATEQVSVISHDLSLQFEMLESLSTYLGGQDRNGLSDNQELLRSFVVANKLCTVAYTDKEGEIQNAFSADGEAPSGNIADRTYFKEALFWNDARAIQYMPHTAMTPDPRILFAVPIVRDNAVDGVVFASTEQGFFDEKIWSGSIANQTEVFLIDGEGLILSAMTTTPELQTGLNFFTAFDGENHTLQDGILSIKNGELTWKNNGTYFIAYRYTGINDWYVVSLIEKETAIDRYSQNMNSIKKIVSWVCALFAFFTIVLFCYFFLLGKQRRIAVARLEDTSRNLSDFLRQSGNAAFEFNARTATFYPSQNLEELIGYKLPKNWFSIINERVKQHPEFNYRGIIEAYNDILFTGEYREVVSCIRLEDKGLRWLKISMTAAFDHKGEVSGMIGFVTDITEAYVDEHLEKEEQTHIMQETLSFIPMSVSVNLSKNTYSMISHLPPFIADLPWEGRYDDIVSRTSKVVPDSHRQSFADVFSRTNLLRAYAEGKKTIELEIPIIYVKGEAEKWGLSKASFIQNKASDDVRMLAMIIDISQQKERALKLQESYDITINNMPGFACKWLFDGDDVILLEANPSFFRFMKAPKEKLLNQSIFAGFEESRRNELLSDFYAREKQKEAIRYSGENFKYDGEKFWAMINATYYSTQNGHSVYLCALSDISGIVSIREKAMIKTEEIHLVANMAHTLVLRYNVAEKKIYVLSNGTGYTGLSQLDGHSPEVAVASGIVPIVDGALFYNAFKAIEHGKKEGKIRFVANVNDSPTWVSGEFRTQFDQNGNPNYAIIMINETGRTGIAATAKMLTDFYDKPAGNTKKMMVVNLSEDLIEFESELDDYSPILDGIESFSEAKAQVIAENKISPESQKEWLDFLNNDRLLSLYRSGIRMDSATFRANTVFGNNREVQVNLMLQESQFENCVRAFIVFKDSLAMADTVGKAAPNVTAEREKKVTIHTFGYFEVFIDGRPISFTHDKSKEMLAVLVDRRGGFVSSSEMIGYLWEDETSNKTTQSRCRQVASRLKRTLEEYGVGDIIETVNGRRRVIPEKVDCDYFKYLGNKAQYRHLFNGSYMMNYSWGEVTTADLESSKSAF